MQGSLAFTTEALFRLAPTWRFGFQTVSFQLILQTPTRIKTALSLEIYSDR